MLNLRALYSASICVLQVTRYHSAKNHLLLRNSLHTRFPQTTQTRTAINTSTSTCYNSNVSATRIFTTGSTMFPPRRSARLHSALASTPGDNESTTRITKEKQPPPSKKRKEAPQNSAKKAPSARPPASPPRSKERPHDELGGGGPENWYGVCATLLRLLGNPITQDRQMAFELGPLVAQCSR